MRRLRIVSDGTVFGTRVYDADTNEDISYGVDGVRIEISLDDGPRAWLSFPDTAIDIVAQEQPSLAGDFEIESSVFDRREDTVTLLARPSDGR